MNYNNFTVELMLKTNGFKDAWLWTLTIILLSLLLLNIIDVVNISSTLFINLTFANTSDLAKSFWQLCAFSSDIMIITPIGLLIMLFYTEKDKVLGLLATIAIVLLIVTSLKILLDSDRPAVLSNKILLLGSTENISWSFPSSNAAISFAILGFFLFKNNNNVYKSIYLFFAILFSISTVVSGSNWVVDIVAGAIIGWFSAYLGILVDLTITIPMPTKVIKTILVGIFVVGISLLFTKIDYSLPIYFQYVAGAFISMSSLYFIKKFS